MKTRINKTMATFTAILLVLSMSTSLILFPNANAHTPPWTEPTYTYVSVSPNPVGVGQAIYINIWINTPPPTAIAPPYPDLWQNLTVVVTDPNGKTSTLGPVTSDASGGTAISFTPTQTGNYTFQSFFGGQTLNPNPPTGTAPSAAAGDYYQPSKSSIVTLVVQNTPIAGPSSNALPTTYWTRPIYATNNNWNVIGGNWALVDTKGVYNATGNYNPYTTAPTTGHIMWTKPEAFGGTIGGEFGSSLQSNYYSTRQYDVMYTPIIMNGILYYTEYPGASTNPTCIEAVDLRTGQTLWTISSPLAIPSDPLTPASVATAGPSTVLAFGQILNYYSANQYGGLAYLWTTGTPAVVASATNIAAGSTTYNMFDADTGSYILSVVNGTAFSTQTEDASGDVIAYYINSSTANAYNAPTLNMWNSTRAILKYGYDRFVALGLNVWRPPQGGIIPFSAGIQWSMPLATNISGAPITLGYSGISSGVILMDQYSTTGGGIAFQNGWIVEAGYSSDTGQLLWGPVNRTENVDTRVSFGTTGNGNAGYAIGDGAWVECDLNSLTVTGYNLFTGTKLWGPEPLPNANPYSSLGMQQIVANGTIYIWTYGGDVYSINIQTGAVNWQYHSPPAGTENPYGINILWTSGGRGVLADGLLILAEGHEFVPPLYHGAYMLAFNTTNGQIAWQIMGFYVNGVKAIADGILTTINAYDNQIYAFGTGPSKTTVTAPNIGVTTATPITITGTVTDISSGSQQQAVAANFPNGLPCVSDSSMTQFMEAVYMQQPMPNNITGVPVTLSVVDANGNNRIIGTTVTNAMGAYDFTWTPDIAGNYTVIATFAGSGSYYGSSAETYFYASSPTSTSSPQPVQAQPPTGMYVAAASVAIIVVIIIGFALTIFMLRKRP